jgi:dipeptidyl aminopeptidase/acylaminoacyl peptidase
MMRPLVFGALISLAVVQQQPASNPEVYLVDLGPAGSPKLDGTLVNISNSPGYDNQPSFTPDGKAILFSSVRGDTQYDIYRYDIASKSVTNLTRSPENENSPLVTPDGKTFSAVRTEMDKTQRLYRFDADGSNPRVVLENVKPVGYHVWVDATHVALFVLAVGQGQPNTLQLADTATGTAVTIDTNIGRSLLMRPGTGTVSFVSKKTTPWMVSEFDPKTRVVLPVTGPLPQELDRVEDCAWDPSGRLIMAKGSTVWALPFGPKFEGWTKLADLSSAGIDKITRLATNVNGGRLRLALVAEPVAK